MKFGFKQFYKPTPAKFRKLGDTLAAISLTIAGYALTANHPWVGYVGLGCGIASKVITNMITDEIPKG